MQNLSKLALSIFCTLVASNMFAQCPAGSPCAQRNAGYYQDNNDDYYAPRYDNSNYDRSPRYRQQYRSYYDQNPGYGQNDRTSYPSDAKGYSQDQDYPPQYASTTSQYQYMGDSQVAEDSSSPYSMTNQTMTTPANQGNQSYMGAPNRNNAPNAQSNRMMNQGNMPDSSMPTRGTSPNPQGK